GPGGSLQLTQAQKNALAAFIKTLTGSKIYNEEKWSSPFDVSGNLNGSITGIVQYEAASFNLFPNPAAKDLKIDVSAGSYELVIINMKGQIVLTKQLTGSGEISLEGLENGLLIVELSDLGTGQKSVKKLIKNDL